VNAVDAVDELIERYQQALGEFMKGTPSLRRSYSHIEKT